MDISGFYVVTRIAEDEMTGFYAVRRMPEEVSRVVVLSFTQLVD